MVPEKRRFGPIPERTTPPLQADTLAYRLNGPCYARLSFWGLRRIGQAVAPVGEGISEMRIDIGPGYRVYCTRIGEVIYLLLVGGDKLSQSRDIKRAIALARMLRKE